VKLRMVNNQDVILRDIRLIVIISCEEFWAWLGREGWLV
jgi:hypothetical protein